MTRTFYDRKNMGEFLGKKSVLGAKSYFDFHPR